VHPLHTNVETHLTLVWAPLHNNMDFHFTRTMKRVGQFAASIFGTAVERRITFGVKHVH
jgi:hypothetical protein